jgi:hypothetical protein
VDPFSTTTVTAAEAEELENLRAAHTGWAIGRDSEPPTGLPEFPQHVPRVHLGVVPLARPCLRLVIPHKNEAYMRV